VNVIDTHLVRHQGMKDLAMKSNIGDKGESKDWKDVDGNPTTDENMTHWDENGFLEIREDFDDQEN
jgi:hypothetical protein